MLSNNFEGMKGYIKYMLTWTNKDGIMFSQAPDTAKPNRWMNLGDWCAPGKLPSDELVHTFYLWRCADLASKTATTLGQYGDAAEFKLLAEKTRTAFLNKYFDKEKGSYGPYGGNIFALKMGVHADQYQGVLSALKSDIAANSGNLDTGIFGTQFFFEVLAENGLNDLAYEAMNKKTKPGYGWWIDQGATTTWEQWDGSGSRNHPMFGGGINWFYRVLAGMNTDPNYPGYQNIIFKPQAVGDVTFASYSNETPYGLAAIKWEKKAKTFILNINVPVGSTATIYVPASKEQNVTENGNTIQGKSGVNFQKMENGYAVFVVGSGDYSFNSNL
jgi:alpha-L-rhamnosidase